MSPPLMTTPGPAKSTPSSQVHADAPDLYRVSSPGIARVLSTTGSLPPDATMCATSCSTCPGSTSGTGRGRASGVLAPGVDRGTCLSNFGSTRLRRPVLGMTRGRTAASLSVKWVVYPDPATSDEHLGVASHHLCDLEPGDNVAVTGPVGTHFLLPEVPASNLILVATGTGIAPFRGFLRRIYLERDDWTGSG